MNKALGFGVCKALGVQGFKGFRVYKGFEFVRA